MRFRVATWNMDHWKGAGRDREHTTKAWQHARDLGADVVLLQEAVAPPRGFDATVLPSPDAQARWHSGGRAAFGTAIAVFGFEAKEVGLGPLLGDRTARLTQTHEAAFVAARVAVGAHEIAVVSLYGMLEGPLFDKQTYAVTSMHRSLSDLTPLLNARSTMRVLGGDLNVSTQMRPPDRAAHRVVFDRIAAFGLGDCTRATADARQRLGTCICEEGDACRHVQTHRNPKSPVPWQLDYLFASEKQLMSRLTSCRAIDDDDRAWELSDHCPVIAEFEL
jgi:exonuclease III